MAESVVVVGLQQRSAPLALFERLRIEDDAMSKALAGLCALDGVDEAVVLSTCMRTEAYLVVDRFHSAMGNVRDFFAAWAGVEPEVLSDHLYSYWEEAAVSHLFSVAAGLDSAVLGEGEVLGQVRAAWGQAQGERTAGPVLSGLFRHAVETGKRARSETAISRGATSVATAAVALADERLGGLAGRRAVLLGAGAMGAGMARSLHRGGASVAVCNRSRARAVLVASEVGGMALDMADLAAALHEADILACSSQTRSTLVSRDLLRTVQERRGGKGLLVLDVGVPRNVEADAGDVGGVTLLDIGDVGRFAESARAGRLQEAGRVEDIVAEEVERRRSAVAVREAAPLLRALGSKAEAVRRSELERFKGRLGDLEPAELAAVEAVTRRIVAKLLHPPMAAIRESAGSVRQERLTEALETLFDL